MTPKITICLPTYNSESTIEETLDSLAKQTFKDFDLVVFDNASVDKTVEIVSKYKEQFRSLKIEKAEHNLGAEANFTRCIQYTDQGLMAIYHADDIYHPRIIEEQVRVLSEENLIAVSTRANRIDWKGHSLGKRFIPREFRGCSLVKLSFKSLLSLVFKYGNFIVCPSVMAQAQIMKHEIEKWNGVDFGTSADLDVWLRLSELGSFGLITNPLISYREAQASTSFRLKKVRTHRHDLFRVLDQYKKRMTQGDMTHFQFLEIKDLALRIYNGCIEKKCLEDFKPWKLRYFKLAASTRFHFQFYIKILGIWSIRKLLSVFA